MACITKRQIREIASQLAVRGMRDTDFDVTTSMTSSDYVAIVQDNVNRIISFQSLIEVIADELEQTDLSIFFPVFEVDVDTMHLHVMGNTDEELTSFELDDDGHLFYVGLSN